MLLLRFSVAGAKTLCFHMVVCTGAPAAAAAAAAATAAAAAAAAAAQVHNAQVHMCTYALAHE